MFVRNNSSSVDSTGAEELIMLILVEYRLYRSCVRLCFVDLVLKTNRAGKLADKMLSRSITMLVCFVTFNL